MMAGDSATRTPRRMRLDRTVAEVAALVGGRVEGPDDRRLAALLAPEHAGPDDLAPVFAGAPAALLAGCRAGSLLLGARTALPEAPGGPPGSPPRSVIRVDDADLAVDRLVLALVPAEEPPPPGVHPTALVAPGVELGEGVSVGPHAVLARGARVGARTRLLAGVCLGADARVGADGVLHPYVVLGARCTLGDRVVVHAGAVIGSDGFGFRRDRQGRHTRIPQRGTVVVGDDVEIGAHCTIDRARFAVTRVGDGC
jgi:UDP-3-O-[3-hydroxymyristoyl] glucosamine N-acyltransferase